MASICYSSFNSNFLGKIFVASTEKGVCMVDFLRSERTFLKRLRGRFSGQAVRDDQKNKEVLDQIKEYLRGERLYFDCKLDLRGTPFQKKVWLALIKIPYGQTRSYKEIAQGIGHPKAFRAVGNANSQNPIPLIIPCHRVINHNRDLGGFRYGTKVKKMLLDLEKNLL